MPEQLGCIPSILFVYWIVWCFVCHIHNRRAHNHNQRHVVLPVKWNNGLAVAVMLINFTVFFYPTQTIHYHYHFGIVNGRNILYANVRITLDNKGRATSFYVLKFVQSFAVAAVCFYKREFEWQWAGVSASLLCASVCSKGVLVCCHGWLAVHRETPSAIAHTHAKHRSPSQTHMARKMQPEYN